MKTLYTFDYDLGEASCQIEVDREKFTKEMAEATLNFFSWFECKPDPDNDPIDEVVKKYAWMAILMATKNDHNTKGVISDFEDLEGYASVDGSMGITLKYVEPYELNQSDLEVEIINQ